jgi:3-hydroxyisobutyrate dehydrogenase-like beta-hydroxyacid dehydrogenase
VIVGFIGLGRMGGKMCRCIVTKSPHEVLVHDLSAGAKRAITELGGVAADGIGELAARADVILTSLPGPVEVRTVVLGPGGIAERARPGTVYFDLTTNSPAVTRELAGELDRRGIAMLDAPISGGQQQAAEGTLTIMVGGDRQHFDRHRALLECLASHLVYAGPIGSGQVVKIVNNMLCFTYVAAATEALTLAAAAGLELSTVDDVIRDASGDSRMYRVLAERVLSGDYERLVCTLDIAYKDIHLFLELSDQLAVPSPVTDAVHHQMRLAKGAGYGQLDHTVVARAYEVALAASSAR